LGLFRVRAKTVIFHVYSNQQTLKTVSLLLQRAHRNHWNKDRTDWRRYKQ